jgi:SAM-dependent methyltransferase
MLSREHLLQYIGRPAAELSYATVRDFCDSADHLPQIMRFDGDMKDVQRTWAIKAILGRIPIGASLLEIGAGEPIVANALQSLGYRLTVVDPYDGAGNGPLAYEQYSKDYPRLRLIRSYFDRNTPGLAGETFDAIYSISVLEHLPDASLAELFEAIASHLRPGGCSIHCIDHVVAGATADWHDGRIRAIALLQRRLQNPGADAQELGLQVTRQMDEYFQTMAADLETYYHSALGHNIWRGAMTYDQFPFRRVVSVQMVSCRPI